MKKVILTFGVAIMSIFSINAQTIEEPEFVGEAILIRADETSTPLEKHLAQSRSVASTGLIITGIGKSRTQIQIDGCCANVKIKEGENVKFIIRSIDNLTDPMAIVQIFQLEPKKKYRRAEVGSVSSFGTVKKNNLQYVSFSGKKYGKSSYLITPTSPLKAGEYGITISNPNAVDEKQTVISTFAVTK